MSELLSLLHFFFLFKSGGNVERNAALKQPFRLEENSDVGLLSSQHVTGLCLCLISTKVSCFNPLISFTSPHVSHRSQKMIFNFEFRRGEKKEKNFEYSMIHCSFLSKAYSLLALNWQVVPGEHSIRPCAVKDKGVKLH